MQPRNHTGVALLYMTTLICFNLRQSTSLSFLSLIFCDHFYHILDDREVSDSSSGKSAVLTREQDYQTLMVFFVWYFVQLEWISQAALSSLFHAWSNNAWVLFSVLDRHKSRQLLLLPLICATLIMLFFHCKILDHFLGDIFCWKFQSLSCVLSTYLNFLEMLHTFFKKVLWNVMSAGQLIFQKSLWLSTQLVESLWSCVTRSFWSCFKKQGFWPHLFRISFARLLFVCFMFTLPFYLFGIFHSSWRYIAVNLWYSWILFVSYTSHWWQDTLSFQYSSS